MPWLRSGDAVSRKAPDYSHRGNTPDSDLGQLALISAGAGIGICQGALTRSDPKLKRVPPTTVGFAQPMWVVMRSDLRHHRRCKVAYDALVDGPGAQSEQDQ